MKAVLGELERRREALVERSERERRAIATGVTRLGASVADPALVAFGAAAVLAAGSPRLRRWFVRAWIVGAFLRRLLAR